MRGKQTHAGYGKEEWPGGGGGSTRELRTFLKHGQLGVGELVCGGKDNLLQRAILGFDKAASAVKHHVHLRTPGRIGYWTGRRAGTGQGLRGRCLRTSCAVPTKVGGFANMSISLSCSCVAMWPHQHGSDPVRKPRGKRKKKKGEKGNKENQTKPRQNAQPCVP